MSEQKEITIYDIAKKLDISATTVSRGLNNNPRINEKTRKKIFECAKELGYRSNLLASNLRNRKSNTIGVIVPKLNSHFMSSALAGMESIARKRGFNLIISQSAENDDKEKENAIAMFNNRVDGLLVSLSHDSKNLDYFEPFYNRGTPIVFFDHINQNSQSTTILIDNYQAAYDVTKHLIAEGCRRIMHFTGNTERKVYSNRLKGYKDALQDYQIQFDPELLQINHHLNEEAGQQLADYILQMKNKPDAVFAANDTCAVYCMIKLMQAGIKIPMDIAFAGFNNDPISNVIHPNLTTVNYPGFTIGETAANNLINELEDVDATKNAYKIILRSELIIRASSLKNK